MIGFHNLVFPEKEEINIDELFLELQRSKDEKIREVLIIHHMNLVHLLAKKFIDWGKPLESLVSVGTIGLINAIDRYDAAKGVKFSTYATYLILGEIRRYFRDKCWLVKVPRKTRKLNRFIQEVIEEMTKDLNRSPSISELARKLDASKEEVIEALEARNAYNAYSLGNGLKSENGNLSMLEYLSSDDLDLKTFNNKFDLEEVLHHLPKREQVIIRLYYFDGFSQTKIARRLDISQMHVSRLLKQALKHLKKMVKD